MDTNERKNGAPTSEVILVIFATYEGCEEARASDGWLAKFHLRQVARENPVANALRKYFL